MARYYDWVDYLIFAGYAAAGVAAGKVFMDGGTLLEVATAGFAVAGATVTLALVLSGIDKALQNHYNR
jgi:hypothetical protein